MTRPTLPNGLRTWLDAPDIALPVISLRPHFFEPHWSGWTASIMLGDMGESHYVERKLLFSEIPTLLFEWQMSPEACCRKWFHHEPPHGSAPPPDTNPEDLDL